MRTFSGVIFDMSGNVARVGLFVLSASVGSVVTSAVLAGDRPNQVTAHYNVLFAGFKVGSLHFRSEVGRQRYSLTGDAKVSAMFGAFKWRGSSRSSGRARKGKPQPESYALDYRTKKKSGSVRMSFKRGNIVKNEIVPRKGYSKKHAPLLKKHLRGVFDPVSAIMAMTTATKGHPCRQRIPVFDGKQRFDLVLSPAGRKKIREAARSGQPGMAYVCRVKYVPIGGYKRNRQTAYMAKNDGMRITLRAVPSANLWIPYEVRIPTFAGEAVVVSKRVNIVTARRQRIALVN